MCTYCRTWNFIRLYYDENNSKLKTISRKIMSHNWLQFRLKIRKIAKCRIISKSRDSFYLHTKWVKFEVTWFISVFFLYFTFSRVAWFRFVLKVWRILLMKGFGITISSRLVLVEIFWNVLSLICLSLSHWPILSSSFSHFTLKKPHLS